MNMQSENKVTLTRGPGTLTLCLTGLLPDESNLANSNVADMSSLQSAINGLNLAFTKKRNSLYSPSDYHI